MTATIASAVDFSHDVFEFFKEVTEKANFPGGIALGMAFAFSANYFANRWAAEERLARMKVDAEREQVLQKQLNTKDERITELHKQLSDFQKELAKSRHQQRK